MPASAYSDSSSVFFINNSQPDIEQQLAGEARFSQFGRALDELRHRNDPFAFTAIQKAGSNGCGAHCKTAWYLKMRLEGISAIEQANAFLDSFVPRFNARFAHEAAEQTAEWLKAPADLDWHLCAKCLKNGRKR